MNSVELFPELHKAFYQAELIIIKKLIEDVLSGRLPAKDYDVLKNIHERTGRILKNETTA